MTKAKKGTSRDFYYIGEHKCYSYYAKRGDNYEVAFYFGKDRIFYGNFIYAKEAKSWYKLMAKYLMTFTKKYTYAPGTPVQFYKDFCQSYLYKMYYSYLDTCFSTYQRGYTKTFTNKSRKYQGYHKRYADAGQYHMQRAHN
jgi:hypothetical protein